MRRTAVGAEQELVRTCAPRGLNQVIETADAQCVGIDVGPPHQLIDYLLMRSPVVAEAAEVGNNERHVRVLRGHHFHRWSVAAYVHEKGNSKAACRFANLARRRSIRTVDLYPAEIPFPHRLFRHRMDAVRIARAVDKGKAD